MGGFSQCASPNRTVQLQLLQNYSRGIDLDCRDAEWFALETHRDHSVICEAAPEDSISDFLDCEDYCVSSEGSLPTVVDTMVVCVQLTRSRPF